MIRKLRKIRAKRPFKAEGLRLRAFRIARHGNADWKEYAVIAGLDPHAYRQNENGITLMSVANALLLKAKYGITTDYIYAGDDSGMPIGIVRAIHEQFVKLTKE